jgi:hypothetical protein
MSGRRVAWHRTLSGKSVYKVAPGLVNKKEIVFDSSRRFNDLGFSKQRRLVAEVQRSEVLCEVRNDSIVNLWCRALIWDRRVYIEMGMLF